MSRLRFAGWKIFNMSRTIYIFVNGVLTFPGSSNNWNRRAVTHFITEYDNPAESLEYLVFPLTRSLRSRHRSNKLAKKIWYYQLRNWRVVLVGHSNGANVIFNALHHGYRGMPLTRIEEVHLFSPACSDDADKLDLNRLLRIGRVGFLQLFRAGRDLPLVIAGAFGKPFGYGSLGLHGFSNLDPIYTESGKVVEQYEPDFGHGTWFTQDRGTPPNNFLNSMSRVWEFNKNNK